MSSWPVAISLWALAALLLAAGYFLRELAREGRMDMEIKRRMGVLEPDLLAELKAVRAVLGYREKELLDLKGPCSNRSCRLHHAHSGPCDVRMEAEDVR